MRFILKLLLAVMLILPASAWSQRIGDLPTATSLSSTDNIVVVQFGTGIHSVTKKVTIGTLATAIGTLSTNLGMLPDPSTNGVLVRNATNSTIARTLLGTANQITIVNGSGVSGAPVFSLPNNVIINNNLTVSNSLTSSNLTALTLTVSNLLVNGVQITGTNGLLDTATNGIVVRTAVNTTIARTLLGTTNQITVVNGSGVVGAPVISFPNDVIFPGNVTITSNLTVNGVAFTNGGSGGFGGLVGNTVWVDKVNGNDSTGARGSMATPFLTLLKAKTNALAGDTIYVLPGAYVNSGLISLLKSNVHWHFFPQTYVTNALFTDYEVGNLGTINVTGEGTFFGGGSFGNVLALLSNTVVNFKFKEIDGRNDNPTVYFEGNSTGTIEGGEIKTTSLNTFFIADTNTSVTVNRTKITTSNTGVNAIPIRITANNTNLILRDVVVKSAGGTNSIGSTTFTPTIRIYGTLTTTTNLDPHIIVRSGGTDAQTTHISGRLRIVDGTQAAGYVLTSDANGNSYWQDPAPAYLGATGNAVWVDKINGNDATGLRGTMSKSFLTPEAAVAAAASGDTIFVLPGNYVANQLEKNGVNWHFFNGAVVTNAASLTHAIFEDTTGTDKFTITGDGVFEGAVFSLIGSTVKATFSRINGNPVNGGDAAGLPIYFNGGGSLELIGGEITSESTQAIFIASGGTPVLTLRNCKVINTLGIADVPIHSVTSSSVITLRDCVLVSAGTYSLSGTSPMNARIYGRLMANKTSNNITFITGSSHFEVDTDVQ